MSDQWHYLENQFLNVTRERRGLLDELSKDHTQKLTQAAQGNPTAMGPLLVVINAAATPWAAKYKAWKDAKAEYRSRTQQMDNLLAVLRVRPVGGDRSLAEDWDSRIRAYWSPGHPIYDGLLPQGREPLTTGTRDEIISEVERLGGRLATRGSQLLQQAPGDPNEARLTAQGEALTALGSEVTAFHVQLSGARNTQTQKEGLVDQLSEQLEPLRVAVCVAMFKNLGSLMALFAANPGEVSAFYDLDKIISPPAPDEEEEPEPEPPAGGEGGGGTPVSP